MSDQETPNDSVRLGVNINYVTAAELKSLCAIYGESATYVVRRAISLLMIISDAQLEGQRVLLATGEGEGTKFTALVTN